jgi:hypothetical protein
MAWIPASHWAVVVCLLCHLRSGDAHAERLRVEGHVGSHFKAMGVFIRDVQLAFGVERFVQLDSEGRQPPSEEAFFLYRGGVPGRWIITKGEAGINQKQ